MRHKIYLLGIMTVTGALACPAHAEMSPAGGAMIGIHAAKAVKKHREKEEQEQALAAKLAKLQERYPQDVADYKNLKQNNPDAAAGKLRDMISKYKADTGVDLDEVYKVKTSEGPIKNLRKRLSGENEAQATPPPPPAPEKTAPATPAAPTQAVAPAPVTPTPTPAATPAPVAPAAAATANSTPAATPATQPAKPHRGLLRDLLGGVRNEIREGRQEMADAVEGKTETKTGK